jgi:dTDP-4-amino-4,6-dideoxygalactose transaminase
VSRVYLSPPDIGEDERRMLLEALDSNWIAPLGPDVDAFERELAERTGVPHAVALSSGTAALHVALRLAGVESGDEVLVPSFTFIASAAAVGRLPSAVLAVDLYGETADYRALTSLSGRFDVPLIEDSAEALGSTHRGCAAGAFGVAGIFSFNGNKILTTSGGGMLMTASRDFAERAHHLAAQAREPFAHYEHNTIGYNYRLSNLLAALGRAQLRGLDRRIARRQQIDAVYRDALGGLPGVSPMPRSGLGTSNYWLTCVEIDPEAFGSDREDVRKALEAADIESRPTWKPLHLQPAFSGAPLVGPGHCAGVFDRGLCLPTGSALSPAEQSRVIEIFTSQARF